ncbi:MAG TPA: hypothetical protein P5513_04040 [Candidatus Diapherotrites archaeon]|nr:hypothetical protein [Candidatus Diapherotrites archaeon]
MSDGISEVMEGTYFLDRSKNSEERYKKYKEIEEREKREELNW